VSTPEERVDGMVRAQIQQDAMVRAVGMVCRAVVAVVMCMTGSCTISNVFAPVPQERVEQVGAAPQCAHNDHPGYSSYRCTAPAAYCGRHHEALTVKPESGK
jgi:hypothetical protein